MDAVLVDLMSLFLAAVALVFCIEWLSLWMSSKVMTKEIARERDVPWKP